MPGGILDLHGPLLEDACADSSCSHSINTGTAQGIIPREIVNDLEVALEQFRETIKSSIWIPDQARNDASLEISIDRNAGEPVSMRLFR